MSIRVVIADDQRLVRAGFRMILGAEDDIDVVGEAGDGDEAVAEATGEPVDVVLMDVRMPGCDGIEATRRIMAAAGQADGQAAGQTPRVLMLTTFDMDEYVYDALRAGASGFLLKESPPETLVAAVRTVAAGESILAPSVTRRMIERFTTQARPAVAAEATEGLTARELEVLRLLGRAMTNAEIAGELYVSEATVKTHIARILMKLDLRDRVQAAVFAHEHGVVGPRG